MMNREKTVLVSGATGLIGSALCARLRELGYSVRALSRSRGDVSWDPNAGTMEDGALEGVDAVVHLAGEPVTQRWTSGARQRIMDSRVRSTQILVDAILAQAQPPAYVAASGVNFYGYHCDGWVDESAPSGDGFLAEVCRAWEGAAQPLEVAGVRSVFVRTGVVLSASGGALAKMLPVFKLGLGGRIGFGTQLMSWIALPDLVEVYVRVIVDATATGPINAVAPKPATNNEFTEALGRVLGRPTVFSVPRIGVKTMFGEMGKETVMANIGVKPMVLQRMGFEWKLPDLEVALTQCVGNNDK